MEKPIIRDILFLSRHAEDATREDIPVAMDLLDTLTAHREDALGLAANMIGVNKRILVYTAMGGVFAMCNPEIIRKSGAYQTEEGCLSIPGIHPVTRYQHITVKFRDERWREKTVTLHGITAQTVQHEMDHFSGLMV